MRAILAALCGLILAVDGTAAAARHANSRHKALHEYRRRVFNRESAARAGGVGAINTARNVPHEWGRGAGGFARRAGSAFGQHVVKGTIEFGVGALHHEDLHYHRSHLRGTWPRLKYAVKSTFIVPRTNKRGKTLATGRIAGNIGGGLVSRAWQPASAAGLGAGLASGGIGIGADAGANVAREFWPNRRRRRHPARRRR